MSHMQIRKIQKSEKVKALLSKSGEIKVSAHNTELNAGPYTITHCDLSDPEDFFRMLERCQIDVKYDAYLS